MIDVIIPAYNAEKTLQRAVQSVLNQPELSTLWIVDDASNDNTLAFAESFARQVPHKIRVERMGQNSGVAKARNWGALQSNAKYIAFLDADDAYENGALQVAKGIFDFRPDTGVVRLALKPMNLATRYTEHPHFARAWQSMQMTCGGNVVFQRAFFLACGGFPQDQLFRQFGGEDGALGIATTQSAAVVTAFDEVGVLHYCREGMHAEYLLDALLFKRARVGIGETELAYANNVSLQIQKRLAEVNRILNSAQRGICPVKLSWE